MLSLILCLSQYASRQLLRLAVSLFSVVESSGKATETMEMRPMFVRPFHLLAPVKAAFDHFHFSFRIVNHFTKSRREPRRSSEMELLYEEFMYLKNLNLPGTELDAFEEWHDRVMVSVTKMDQTTIGSHLEGLRSQVTDLRKKNRSGAVAGGPPSKKTRSSPVSGGSSSKKTRKLKRSFRQHHQPVTVPNPFCFSRRETRTRKTNLDAT